MAEWVAGTLLAVARCVPAYTTLADEAARAVVSRERLGYNGRIGTVSQIITHRIPHHEP